MTKADFISRLQTLDQRLTEMLNQFEPTWLDPTSDGYLALYSWWKSYNRLEQIQGNDPELGCLTDMPEYKLISNRMIDTLETFGSQVAWAKINCV